MMEKIEDQEHSCDWKTAFEIIMDGYKGLEGWLHQYHPNIMIEYETYRVRTYTEQAVRDNEN